MHTRSLLAISATPIQLFADDDGQRILETVILDNLGGSAAAAYLKIWVNRPTIPDPATVLADVLLPVPIGVSQPSPFAFMPGQCWIACSTPAGTGVQTASADVVNALVCWG